MSSNIGLANSCNLNELSHNSDSLIDYVYKITFKTGTPSKNIHTQLDRSSSESSIINTSDTRSNISDLSSITNISQFSYGGKKSNIHTQIQEVNTTTQDKDSNSELLTNYLSNDCFRSMELLQFNELQEQTQPNKGYTNMDNWYIVSYNSLNIIKCNNCQEYIKGYRDKDFFVFSHTKIICYSCIKPSQSSKIISVGDGTMDKPKVFIKKLKTSKIIRRKSQRYLNSNSRKSSECTLSTPKTPTSTLSTPKSFISALSTPKSQVSFLREDSHYPPSDPEKKCNKPRKIRKSPTCSLFFPKTPSSSRSLRLSCNNDDYILNDLMILNCSRQNKSSGNHKLLDKQSELKISNKQSGLKISNKQSGLKISNKQSGLKISNKPYGLKKSVNKDYDSDNMVYVKEIQPDNKHSKQNTCFTFTVRKKKKKSKKKIPKIGKENFKNIDIIETPPLERSTSTYGISWLTKHIGHTSKNNHKTEYIDFYREERRKLI